MTYFTAAEMVEELSAGWGLGLIAVIIGAAAHVVWGNMSDLLNNFFWGGSNEKD